MTRALFITALLAASACHDAPLPAPNEPPTASPRPGDEVVATVDGRPITASALALQARASGKSARAALVDLIDAEALVGEAARRGLGSDAEVVDATHAALVRRLLKTVFETEVRPENIDQAELARAYAADADRFDHDELRIVIHILAAPLSKEAANLVSAHDYIAELSRRAATVKSEAEFRALAVDAPATTKLEVAELATGRVGYTVTPFANASFAIPRVGAISPPVETRFGWHLIYLKSIVPAQHVPLAEAAPLLRQNIFPQVQRREFLRFADEAATHHRVVVHSENLDRPEK